MKLKKLSSPTGLMKKDIKFKEGLNIIKGAYEDDQERRNDRNGIGKSSVIRLIDFALLSDSGKKYFDPDKYELFEGHKVILEFEIDDETYYIKRSMDNPGEPKFGTEKGELNKYDNPQDLKINLGNKIFSDFRGEYTNSFRDLLSFFLKDDIAQKDRKEPYLFSKDRKHYHNYIYCMYLMGMPTEALREFDRLKDKRSDLRDRKKELKDRLKDETGRSLEEARATLTRMERDVKDIKSTIESSKFFEGYEDIEDEIVSLSKQISEEVHQINELKNRLEDIRESYEYDIEIDRNEVEEIYNEVDHNLGKFVRKSLEDVLEMRDKLAENRRNFLEKREDELESKIEDKQKKVSELEKKRSKHYTYLKEKEALDSFENSYERLINKQKEKERLESHVEQINSVQQKLNEIDTQISEVKNDLFNDIKSNESKRNKLQVDFSEFISEAGRVDNRDKIIFDISSDSDSQYPFKMTVEVPKKNSDGKQQLKNVGFDITVFKNIVESSRDLPHFLVHDGAFKGIDKLTVLRTLNYMERLYHKESNFQYVVTANEEDLRIAEGRDGDLNTEFNIESSTILTLKDKEEEMLFQEEYDT